jgi:archaellum biogenesis protein FlaJ (TadC family)
LYIDSDIEKGFILAKLEFNRANSLFQYIYDHYYLKAKINKSMPIPLPAMAFMIDLSQVMVRVCKIVELISKESNKSDEDKICKKIAYLVQNVETLFKSAKKDK